MIDKTAIMKDFSVDELKDVASELDLDPDHIEVSKLVETIFDDIDENGIPDTGEMSDCLFELLNMVEYIDDDGNITEIEESELKGGDAKEPIGLPACWGYADEQDPACRKCKRMDKCVMERDEKNPECFGKMYNKQQEDCKTCVVAQLCKLKLES